MTRSILLVLGLLAAFAPPAGAATDASVAHFTLANGLEVVVVPDHRAPVVTHMIWYKVGSADETPADALRCHERGRTWLEAKLATKWDGPTVVVSHHAPSLLGTDAKFRNDYLTGAFISDLEELIKRYSPTTWIHGHTHHCVQYIVGKTRLVANQMGYPHEPATGQFDPRLVVYI